MSSATTVLTARPRRLPLPPSAANKTPAQRRTWNGHQWAAVLTILGFIAGVGGLGKIAYYVFTPAALVITGYLLWRKRWYDYLSLTGWMWLLTPFLRRVIEWKVGYHSQSLMLLPPAIAGLMAIPVALKHIRRVDRSIGIVFVISLITYAYGAGVGVLRNGAVGTAVDILAVVGPLGAGLLALTVPDDPARMRKTLVQLAVYGAIIIGAYGIIQFFLLPAWDAKWMIDSGVTTTGRPIPGHVRVFSTLNDSTPFALVLAPLMLVSLAERRWFLRALVLITGIGSLGLSLVRTAWIAITVATIGLLNNGRVKVKTLALFVLGALAVIVIIGGPAAESLYNRFDKSVNSGSGDTSLQARLSFQGSIAGPTLTDVVGSGMGSTGTALKLGGAVFVDRRFASVDSGIFEIATTFGSVLGLTLVIGLFVANVSLWRRSRHGPPEVAYFAAAVTVLTASLFFVDTAKNAPGFLLWVFLAVGARAIPRQASPAPSPELADTESRA